MIKLYMWGIMAESFQIVFDPFIISAIIYGFAIIAGCTNLYKWRGLRIGLFGFIYLALSSWASGISFYHQMECYSSFLYFVGHCLLYGSGDMHCHRKIKIFLE